MKLSSAHLAAFAASVFAGLLTQTAGAQPSGARAITIAVDASQAAQKIYHVTTAIPVTAGPFTFVYPKWIPGYHGPVGPIEAVVNLRVSANGTSLPWRHDLVDFYATHVDVPAGATTLDLAYDIVGAPSTNGQNQPIETAQLAVLEYSNFIMYGAGSVATQTPVDATLTLPAGWTFGTALPVRSTTGSTVSFATASLYTLVDSPIIAGAHERAFALADGYELDVAADDATGIEVTPKLLAGMKHLVAEGPALYGGKHYRDYHFLLTLSDAIAPNGIEHHESSDNRASAKYASDDATFRPFSDLMAHEYSHSWNGKYRRPADLATPDYQAPERTDLLWIYEGLNQYLGEKLATRARLNSFGDELDTLAAAAASMDNEIGRRTRPLRDTADLAPILYESPGAWHAIRRSAGDFYTEGNLIWLDADVTIRKLTNGRRSLDDFCKRFTAGETVGAPVFVPYELSDVIADLQAVAPYDWADFFKKRIDTATEHAPLDGIVHGGYMLTYTDKASNLWKAHENLDKTVDVMYSLGFTVSTDDDSRGAIRDILPDSAAFRAGLAPSMRIIAVDGHRFSADVLHEALAAHAGKHDPMEIIASSDDFVRVYHVDASLGERIPHLARVAGTQDELATIYAPKTFVAPVERSDD